MGRRRRHARTRRAVLRTVRTHRRTSSNKSRENFLPAYRPATVANISAFVPCPSCPKDEQKRRRSAPARSSKRRRAMNDRDFCNRDRGNDRSGRHECRSQCRADRARAHNAIIPARQDRHLATGLFPSRRSVSDSRERLRQCGRLKGGKDRACLSVSPNS